jgi:plastocyanin
MSNERCLSNKEAIAMKAQRFMVGSALLILAGCQHMGMGGGDSMPTVTRTGMVKDVIIREDVAPATLTVNPGDEIRWINKRQGAARVVFLDPVTEQLSCQRNFGGMMAGSKTNQYTANLSSNDSASLCFRNAGEIKYVVRADSTLPSGEVNIPGTITVGSANAGTATTSHSDRTARDTQANEMGESSRMQEDRTSPR